MPNSGQNKPSIVFLGSGPVAAASLELLVDSFTIEAVITKPRAAHHKGDVPVLSVATELKLPIFTATDKQSLSELMLVTSFHSKVAVLIDFGIIVEQDVIDAFPLGIVNSHFSLLPEWRGADPIAFSLLSGQKQTGVSLMLLVRAMDEGPLLAQAPLDIEPNDTITTLTHSLVALSYETLAHILPLYLQGSITPAPQEAVTIAPTSTPSYSRKLTKADAILNFNKPAEVLEREIRAFIKWPKSKTKLGKVDVIITKAHAVPSTIPEEPGHIEVLSDPGRLMINTTDGYLCIDELKPAGKANMTIQAFLNGYGKLLK
jgi:methionyl-tRNA formyltransferase